MKKMILTDGTQKKKKPTKKIQLPKPIQKQSTISTDIVKPSTQISVSSPNNSTQSPNNSTAMSPSDNSLQLPYNGLQSVPSSSPSSSVFKQTTNANDLPTICEEKEPEITMSKSNKNAKASILTKHNNNESIKINSSGKFEYAINDETKLTMIDDEGNEETIVEMEEIMDENNIVVNDSIDWSLVEAITKNNTDITLYEQS